MRCLVLLLDTDGVFLAGPDSFLAPPDAFVADLQQLIFEKHSTELDGIGPLAVTIYSCLQQRDAKTPLIVDTALADIMGADESLQSPLIAVVPPKHERVIKYLHHLRLIDWDGREIRWPANVSMRATMQVRDLKISLLESNVLGPHASLDSIKVFASPEDFVQQIRLHDSVFPLLLKREYTKEYPLVVALAEHPYSNNTVGAWICQPFTSSSVTIDWCNRTAWILRCLGTRSGVDETLESNVMVYVRQPVVVLWRELYRSCIESNALAYVVGSSGSGKTTAAFVFATSMIDRAHWDVVWFHYTADSANRVQCTKWKEDSFVQIEIYSPSRIVNVLDSCCSRPTIVFFDGLDMSNRLSVDAWTPCVAWRSGDKIRRRLVCVTSMVSAMAIYDPSKTTRLPPKVDVDGVPPTRIPLIESVFEATVDEPREELRSIMELGLTAWSLDEYLEAVQHDGFFGAVEANLRAAGADLFGGETTLANRIALVENKFFTVGANAFQMFGVDTGTAVWGMTKMIQHRNLDELVSGNSATTSSRATINRVQAAFFSNQHGTKLIDQRLVSPFVARSLAFNSTMGAVKSFAVRDVVSNDGESFFAAWFTVKLSREGLDCWELREDESVKIEWEARRVCRSNLQDALTSVTLIEIVRRSVPCWLERLERPVGSYDLVRVDVGTNLVEFVQIIHSGTSHRFDYEPFEAWLRGRGEFNVHTVRLIIVMPKLWLDECTLAVDEATFSMAIKRTLGNADVRVKVVVRGVAYSGDTT